VLRGVCWSCWSGCTPWSLLELLEWLCPVEFVGVVGVSEKDEGPRVERSAQTRKTDLASEQ
jgi:hypothetical protein